MLGRFSPSDQREVSLGAGAPASLRRILGEHGDLSAEVGTVASDRRVVIFHVRAQEPLQVPPAPLPLQLGLDLGGDGEAR